MDYFGNNLSTRQAAIHGLAVVGFIALIGSGMWLAVYSTRYVPSVVGRIGTAAVYLGSVFTPAPDTSLSVVPAASSTIISFGNEANATSTVSVPPVEAALPQTQSGVASAPTAGKQTSDTYQLGNASPATTVLSGLPDLMVKITKIGYLATTSADSFIASSTVPTGSRPAVSFTIKNIGTNATGAWTFSASIPTQTAYTYTSQPQQSLKPGESIDYTMGFDQATAGANKAISITANPSHSVTESTLNNNTASTTITVLGS